MDAASIDGVRLAFDPSGLVAVHVAIGLMMFGVALDLDLDDFARVVRAPAAPLVGLAAQFLLLPAATFALTLALRPEPSLALGMILVAACPGGNLSNVITWLARGSVGVSVSMTAISSVAAVVMTPLNLSFWGGLHPDVAPLLQQVALSVPDVLATVGLVLGLPLALGLLTARALPGLADRIRRPFKPAAFLTFLAIVGIALVRDWDVFLRTVGVVMGAVVLHNLVALLLGYGSASALGLPERQRRAVCIEVGIQNSGLGLVLVFSFFDGLGGTAVLVAFWGVWHIVAGLAAATFFALRPVEAPA